MRSASAALACVAAVGCGGDGGSDYTIDDGPLAGQFDGKAWKFVSGDTNDFLSDESGYFATLYSTEVMACASSTGGDSIVLVNVPKEVGSYDFGFSQNLTFAVGSDNFVSTTGVIEVTAVTDTKVSAGLYAIFNEDPNFEISGQFEIDVCPGDGT